MKKIPIILYSKPGCHLCEVMKEEMKKAGCENLYSLVEVNIESEVDLMDRYRFEVPVLRVGGINAFKHQLTAEEFKAYLTQLYNS